MNIDTLSLGVVIAAVIIVLGIMIAYVSFRIFRGDAARTRIQEFVVSPSSTSWVSAEVPDAIDTLQGSLFSRTVIPFFLKIAKFFGRLISSASTEQLNWKLSIARNPLRMRAMEFNGLRILLLLAGIILALLTWLSDRLQNHIALLLGAALIVMTVLLPQAWLNSQVRKAQNEARTGLPDAIDMLSVCAFAGLGFDQSLQRVSDYWRTALGVEFRRVVNEIELGVSRSEALRNMSLRLRIPELTTFVAIIIQAENLGMPIADVLHAQADQMRILRQFRAKEIANKLPAKMIMPLAFMILPALFAVIFAPLVPSLVNLFGGL